MGNLWGNPSVGPHRADGRDLSSCSLGTWTWRFLGISKVSLRTKKDSEWGRYTQVMIGWFDAICPFFFFLGGKGSLLRKICRMIVFVETKSKIAWVACQSETSTDSFPQKNMHTQTPTASSTTKHQTVQHWWILHLPLVKKKHSVRRNHGL